MASNACVAPCGTLISSAISHKMWRRSAFLPLCPAPLASANGWSDAHLSLSDKLAAWRHHDHHSRSNSTGGPFNDYLRNYPVSGWLTPPEALFEAVPHLMAKLT